MATKKDIALVRELRPSNPTEEPAPAKEPALIDEFRLTSLAGEFEQHSQAEIERLGSENPDFDEPLYHEAVSLVLRKLGRYR
jgi:hypothetical protein